MNLKTGGRQRDLKHEKTPMGHCWFGDEGKRTGGMRAVLRSQQSGPPLTASKELNTANNLN